ncbi:uncharacterized protein LOC143024948 [Oratosquilla oratoria]|uniref:uncharacterized protein LOC143024948 n=1 Tax=Oratosquilla oratoria TaxID=337810 RepID=UPI003F75AC4F
MKSYAAALVVLLAIGSAHAGLPNRRPYGASIHHGGHVGTHHGSHVTGGLHAVGSHGGIGGFGPATGVLGGGVHGGLGGGVHTGVGAGIHGGSVGIVHGNIHGVPHNVGHGGICKNYCKNEYHNDYDCCDHLQPGHGLYH